MIFKLPKLNYNYDSLEPYIDAKTMEIHHPKHHAGYVNKLNKALGDHPEYQDKTLEDLIININNIPEEIKTPIRNNGGGHYNHSLFWKIMSPNKNIVPKGKIEELINNKFGSYQNFKEEFTSAALGVFGSGWTWLIQDDKSLEITTTPNQNCPLSQGNTPILGLDVWEHAYYLKYQNKRNEYIENWWNVVDWENVNDLLIS